MGVTKIVQAYEGGLAKIVLNCTRGEGSKPLIFTNTYGCFLILQTLYFSHCRKSAMFSTRYKIWARGYDFLQGGLIEAVAVRASKSRFSVPPCWCDDTNLERPGKTVRTWCAYLLALLRFFYQSPSICAHQLLIFYGPFPTWILGQIKNKAWN